LNEALIECVPNLSEGRRGDAIEAFERAVESVPGVVLLDRHSDPDHNRSVLTFAGPPDAVMQAALALCGEAVRWIDLNAHAGQHPRIGALDVLPFIPWRNCTLEVCAGLARRAGEAIWNRFGVPVYFYESAALRPEHTNLAHIRRGGYERLRQEAPATPARAPDIGGPELHPTAGAVAVGARKFLVAWNVHLDTAEVSAARAIARAIRESSGGLPGVKALGLYLAHRGVAQVSVNLTDFERTGLGRAFRAIREKAAALGCRVTGSELVGLIPRAALETAAGEDLLWENLRDDSVLEVRYEDRLRIKRECSSR
jgi:glutamate formiminotransferase